MSSADGEASSRPLSARTASAYRTTVAAEGGATSGSRATRTCRWRAGEDSPPCTRAPDRVQSDGGGESAEPWRRSTRHRVRWRNVPPRWRSGSDRFGRPRRPRPGGDPRRSLRPAGRRHLLRVPVRGVPREAVRPTVPAQPGTGEAGDVPVREGAGREDPLLRLRRGSRQGRARVSVHLEEFDEFVSASERLLSIRELRSG